LVLLSSAVAPLPQASLAHAAAPESPIERHSVLRQAEKLAQRQLGLLAATTRPSDAAEDPNNPRGWRQAVFWVGMTALADRNSALWVRKAIIDRGTASRWEPGSRPYNADDQLIGSAYVWAARNGAGPKALTPLRTRLDAILANPPKAHLALYLGPEGYSAYDKADCLKRWCWSDALFMAPTAWLALSRQTGDRRYREYALSEFWATTGFLYDPAERLYFRDSRFFELREQGNRKIFWGRGNGWAFAGMARMMDALPAGDPERRKIASLFQEMAARLRQLQKPDGYWPSSLLAREATPPETSGTALFTYGLAWGVKNGILNRADFGPSVRRGWAALEAAIQPDGNLGWVQPAGDRPGQSTAAGTQNYGVGLFLLAATAVADLNLQP
jgi:rhamnogalacturonyl hydrolase YesR